MTEVRSERPRANSSTCVSMLMDSGLEVVNGDFLVEGIRLVLSEAEISCMERAGEITGYGISAAVEALRSPGATDSSVAAAARAATQPSP